MSLNRNRYSSAPLMHIKKQKQERSAPQNGEPPVLEPQRPTRKARRFSVLQVVMALGLPVLFLLALLLSSSILRWSFIAAAVISVALMWILGAFIKSARATLTMIYAVLAIVIGVAIVVSQPNARASRMAAKVDSSSIFSAGSSLDTPGLTGEAEEEEPAAEETAAPVSNAQLRLELFMSYWAEDNKEQMLTLCKPSWVAEQENALSSLFKLVGISHPISYQIEQVFGSDADSSRTIQLVASIQQSNGKGSNNRYQIVMARVNDVWYVDPQSLNSIGIVTLTEQPVGSGETTPTPAPITTTATPVPVTTIDPSTVLYYNADKGSYYHIDPDCASIDKKYRPLTAYFLYTDINGSKYKLLKRCPKCDAPQRPSVIQ